MTEHWDDLTGSDDLQFKAMSGQLNVDEAQGIVECFVAAVGNKDSVGDIVAPGAFDGSLRRRTPRVVWGHDWNQPIGKVLAIEEVPVSDPRLPAKMKAAGVGGLLARVQFNLRSERGREAFNSVAFFGADQEWSIGYKTIKANYDPQAQANVLQEVELFEVSPVLHGANQLTGTISIKAANGDRIDSFDKSQWPMFDRAFAEQIKTQHPDVWNEGGNIKGDDQYQILSKIAEQGGKARTEDQIKALELREAWIARHRQDFQLPGVVAQMKWLAIGTRGEDHMKKTVRAATAKMGQKNHMGGSDIMDMPMERRVRMLVSPNGHGQILNGRNRHFLSVDALRGDGSHLSDTRPGIGGAISEFTGQPIQLRMTDDNFAIYDVADENGDEDTYFLPYHFDGENYMFGQPKQVEVEIDVNFNTEDEDDENDENDDWEAMDDGYVYAPDTEDWDDEEKMSYWSNEDDSERKAIGQAIGPTGPRGNPNDTTDHDGDGMIFDGTPQETRAPRKRQGQGGQPAQGGMRRQVTQGGQTYRVTNDGRRAGAIYGRGKGPSRPAGPDGPGRTPPNDPQFDAARQRLVQMRRDINRRGSQPGQERQAGEQMRQVGAYLRAAEANDRARRNGIPYDNGAMIPGREGQGPSGPRGPRNEVTGRSPEADEAVRRLQERRRQINQRGSSPSGERAAGREMQDVGRYLRAAEANDRARNGTPAGPAGPNGPGASVDRMTAEQRRRAAVAKLNRRRAAINERGSTPQGERRAGQEMQDVGRFLRAAEENQRVRERQVAGRSAGPRGPQRQGGDLQSRRDRNGTTMVYDRNGRLKHYDDPALTFWEASDLEMKALTDPSLTLDDLEAIETKGIGRAMNRPKSALDGIELYQKIHDGALDIDTLDDDQIVDVIDILTDDAVIDLAEKGMFGRIGRAITGRGDTHLGDHGGSRIGGRRGSRLRGRDPRKVRDGNKNGRIFDGTPDEMAAVVEDMSKTPNEPWKLHEPDRGIGESGAEVFRNAHEDIINRRADRWVPHYSSKPGGRAELERIRDEKNKHIVSMEERIDKGEKLSAKDRDELVDSLAHVAAIDDAIESRNPYRLREDRRGVGESSAEVFMNEHEGQISRAADSRIPHYSRMSERAREGQRNSANATMRKYEDKLDREGSLSQSERRELVDAIATAQALDEVDSNLSRYPSRRAPLKSGPTKEEASTIGNPKQVGRALKRDGQAPKTADYGITDGEAADLVGKITSFDDPDHKGVRLGGVITDARPQSENPLDENGDLLYGESLGGVDIWVTHANGELLPAEQQFRYSDIDGERDDASFEHFIKKNNLRIHDR